MQHDRFAELLTSTGEALEHARGKKSLKTTAVPLPPSRWMPGSASVSTAIAAKLGLRRSVRTP